MEPERHVPLIVPVPVTLLAHSRAVAVVGPEKIPSNEVAVPLPLVKLAESAAGAFGSVGDPE